AMLFAGTYFGGASCDMGKVANFEDLNDDVYAYLDRTENVFILNHINKNGQREKFAVTDMPIIEQGINLIKIGESFRKVKNRIIVLN
ncbi:MAG: hypothetical protein PHP62_05895, partial [Candidatus Moranbacteria bacterium]|nr:hypothetical protein [Candidatus Moranbacteria bacterium]